MHRDDATDEAYLDHLSDADLALLLAGCEPPAGSSPRARARREGVERLLASPQTAERVLGPSAGEPLALLSPFLVFAVAVKQTAARLDQATHVLEWVGPGRKAPVFDAPRLRDFLGDPWRRLALAELLASYSRVASGSVLVATRRGWRRQRFSELDPVRLAGLLEAVPAAERPGVLRRLGDLALLLTGVFPDYVARRGFGPVEEARLRRSAEAAVPAGSPALGQASSAAELIGDGGPVGLLAELGQRWYRAAYELMGRPAGGRSGVVGALGRRFDEARRVLGDLTEHHLFGERERYFGLGS